MRKMDRKSWLTGFALGLCGKALPIPGSGKEPVAYLYNGVRLPDINVVWTDEMKAEYSNATILNANGVYCVVFSASPKEAFNTGSVQAIISDKVFKHENGQWIEVFSYKFISPYPAIWTNYDLYYKTTDAYGELSGALYMSASEPVPVYE